MSGSRIAGNRVEITSTGNLAFLLTVRGSVRMLGGSCIKHDVAGARPIYLHVPYIPSRSMLSRLPAPADGVTLVFSIEQGQLVIRH